MKILNYNVITVTVGIDVTQNKGATMLHPHNQQLKELVEMEHHTSSKIYISEKKPAFK